MSTHNHILKRLLNETDAYKHQANGRETFDRWLLEKTFTEDLCETLLTETSPELEFECSTPGIRSDLPAYFADALVKSRYPGNLHPYTEDELGSMRLYKVQGLDAGFGVTSGGDIVAVHNNSEQRGIAEKMLRKAIAVGGKSLDHFDGKLSAVYAKMFPTVERIEPWNDDYAPAGWKYTPVDVSQSYYGGEHRKRKNPVSESEMEQVKANYSKGKPHIIHRKRLNPDGDLTVEAYESHPDIVRLNEAGLSRVWQIASDPSRDFLLASADYETADGLPSLIELASRRDALIRTVRQEGLGYSQLKGKYTGLDQQQQVTEVSFLISGPLDSQTTDKLDAVQTFIFSTLGQESVIRKTREGEIALVYASGERASLGEFSPDKISANYSKLVKGSHAGRTFVFERTHSFTGGEIMIRNRLASRIRPY